MKVVLFVDYFQFPLGTILKRFILYCSKKHSNTDKMTDAEKLPIAIAGIAFITIPFIAGMVALYAAK
jgi:hypothetical protein